MLNNVRYIMLSLCALLSVGGCLDPYEPSVVGEHHNFLVVEGAIISGGGSSNIKLSRSARLADSAMIMPELNAQVQLEGEDQSQYPFSHTGDGQYTTDHLDLQNDLRYRIRINTANGSEYLSEFVAIKNTPPIDKLSWSQNTEGVQVYVNSHDPENATTYYRWEYEEDWEFTSDHYTLIKYVDGAIIVRGFDENLYTCWTSDFSKNIILGSSAKLSEDIISQQPVAFVPLDSWKLSERYSILVRQYGLSKEAFDYLQQMKKNSELGGSIFGPQPTDLSGNIHSLTDPAETVIGFVSAYSVQEKRLYIDKSELPIRPFRQRCETIMVSKDEIDFWFGEMSYIPLDEDRETNKYTSAHKTCVDCTLRGNPNPPDFWE